MSFELFLGCVFAVLVVLAVIASLPLMSMPSTKSIACGGQTFSENLTVSSNDQQGTSVNVGPAAPGILTVRGGNNAGTVLLNNSALPATFGIVTGSRVDVYWQTTNTVTGLVTSYVQYGCTATVTGSNIALASGTDSGVGSVLPVLGTPCSVCLCAQVNLPINATDVVALLAGATAEATIVFQDYAGTDQFDLHLPAGGVASTLGQANPLGAAAYDTATVEVSTSMTSGQATVQVGAATN